MIVLFMSLLVPLSAVSIDDKLDTEENIPNHTSQDRLVRNDSTPNQQYDT